MECGYKESSLVEAMNRVQQLNRADLLQEKIDLHRWWEFWRLGKASELIVVEGA